MQVEISNRSLLVLFPILFCTIAQLTGAGNLLPNSSGSFLSSIIPWIFSLSLASLVPSNNRSWMLIGSTASFFLIFYVLHLIHKDYTYFSLVAVFLGPLSATMIHPHSRRKINRKARIMNLIITFIFMITLSFILCLLAAALYTNIQEWINNLYLSSIYNDSYSFIYGIIYQFCATFGFGGFILEIRHLIDTTSVSQSFYSTTTALYTAGIPAIFLALVKEQPKKRRLFYLLLTILAFISSTTGYSISLLLILFLWLQPSLFGIYIITGIFFYIVGYQIHFAPQEITKSFYNPDFDFSKINFSDYKFDLLSLAVFIVNYSSSVIVLKEKQKYTQNTGQVIRVKPLVIDILSDIGTQDYSLSMVNIIKNVGGFDNILHVSLQENTINFTVMDYQEVNFTELQKMGTTSSYVDNFMQHISFTPRSCSTELYNKIIELAEFNLLDVSSEYHEIEPYSIEKSKFKNLYNTKEEIHAMDSN